MVTPELSDFIQIELDRNTSQEAITEKLLAVGWNAEDIAEGITAVKISKSMGAPAVKIEEKIAQSVRAEPARTQAFDPYRETPVTNTAPVVAEAPVVSPLPVAPLMPDLRPKSLGDMQNQVADIAPASPKPEPIKLEEYQNKLDKIVVPSATPAPTFTPTIPPVVSPKPKKSHHFMRTFFFIIVILALCGGVFYTYTKGYFKLPFEVPFLKKDPHQVLASVPNAMKDVTSFKSDMEMKATFPKVANIISMLMSGSAVTSTDTDYVTIKSKLSYSNVPPKGEGTDVILTGTSSIFNQSIELNLRTLGGTTYAKLLGGQSLLPKDMVLPTEFISINKTDAESLSQLAVNDGRFALIAREKDAIQKMFSSLGWNNIFNMVPIDDKTIIKENQSEVIGGVDTYHYSVTVDTVMMKKFAHSLASEYGFKVTEGEWVNIEKVLSSTSVATFDIWIGKDDTRLYKTNIVLTVPLTKILNLEDKNLSENNLKLSFVSTYHNFNSPITISVPDQDVPVLKVVDTINKSMQDTAKRDVMQALTMSFGQIRDIEKSYGFKANSGGSCADPTVGSLFSPTGHKKVAMEAVSSIAENIITFISISNGQSLCYSTPTQWAIATPTLSDPTKYFCADSAGALMETTTLLNGPVCK